MTATDLGGMCSCDLDLEPMEHIVFPKVVKARKPHRCIECGTAITPGQRYQYSYARWDGTANESHTCLPCVGIRRDFCCGAFGGCVEIFIESYGWDYRELPQ